ncbi:MAG: OmpA family protein [Cyanobacteria bacterium P01_H01_bin.153]
MTELPPFNNPPPRPAVGSMEASQTDSSAVASPTAPTVLETPPAPKRWQGLQVLLAWSLRWGLLGLGVVGAWLFGILVAQFFPASNPEPPMQEVVARKTSRFFQKVGSLPAWWSGETQSTAPIAAPAPAATPPATPEATRPIALTDAQREQVTVELEAIDSELQTLRDRTSAIERQLGLPNIEISLDKRLDNANNRLTPPTEAPPTAANGATPTALQPTVGESPDPLFRVNAYRVTLPSDVLFAPGQDALQPNAQPLLDNILPDIARYSNATIVVGSYTDVETEGNTATELSYQQAIAVQRYLAQRVGDDSLHWVSVGYGNSTLGSTGGVQLSRRITIAITP